MKKEKTLYFAVNRDGRWNVFTSLPERCDAFGAWVGDIETSYSDLLRTLESDGLALPTVTYKDDPVPIRLCLDF